MPGRDTRGPLKGPGRGGRGLGFGEGEGYCVCTGCGYRVKHVRGQPCNQMTCPKCGIGLVRGEL